MLSSSSVFGEWYQSLFDTCQALTFTFSISWDSCHCSRTKICLSFELGSSTVCFPLFGMKLCIFQILLFYSQFLNSRWCNASLQGRMVLNSGCLWSFTLVFVCSALMSWCNTLVRLECDSPLCSVLSEETQTFLCLAQGLCSLLHVQ